MANLIRAHWSIENACRWVLDDPSGALLWKHALEGAAGVGDLLPKPWRP